MSHSYDQLSRKYSNLGYLYGFNQADPCNFCSTVTKRLESPCHFNVKECMHCKYILPEQKCTILCKSCKLYPCTCSDQCTTSCSQCKTCTCEEASCSCKEECIKLCCRSAYECVCRCKKVCVERCCWPEKMCKKKCCKEVTCSSCNT